MGYTTAEALVIIALTALAAGAGIITWHAVAYFLERHRRPRLTVRAECMECTAAVEYDTLAPDPAGHLAALRDWSRDHSEDKDHRTALVLDVA